MTPVGKLDRALAEAFKLFGNGVWIRMVSEDGTEGPQVWSPIVDRDNKRVEVKMPITFPNTAAAHLPTGTYTAIRLYTDHHDDDDLLTEIKLKHPVQVYAGHTQTTAAPAWRFWNQTPDTRWIAGETFTLTNLKIGMTT